VKVLPLLIAALVASGCLNYESGPASEIWIRARHPELPIRFEIPENTKRKEVFPALGNVRPHEGQPPRTHVFGIRSFGASKFYAVEMSFFAVTGGEVGADARLLTRLAGGIEDPAIAEEFYQQVFLDHLRVHNVRFRDLGPTSIDGRPARNLHAERRVNWQWQNGEIIHCDDCPLEDHEIYVAPFSSRFVLVILVTFHGATADEREVIVPRIIRSVRIEPEALGRQGPSRLPIGPSTTRRPATGARSTPA
jgi:hypothetical protein